MTDYEFKAPERTITELDETTARLAEIRERASATTEGPWHWDCTRVDIDPGDPVDIEWGVTCDAPGPTGVAEGITIHADAEFIAAARQDIPWLLSEVERLTAERDRARGLAARIEAQLARVAEVVHGMESLRYVGMTTRADVSDVEAAARTQRAVRAHAADLWAVLASPKDGDVEYQVDPVQDYLDRLEGMDPSPTLAGQIAELEAAHHAKNGGE